MAGHPPPRVDAAALASAAGQRADLRLDQAIGDLFLPDAARLSDRTHAAVHAVLAGVVSAVEADLRGHAARLLAARGADDLAGELRNGAPVLDRLRGSGLLRDPELMEELIARVELDLLAEALPPMLVGLDKPGLLARLAEAPDGVVASAALASLAAENRRRSGSERGVPLRSGLPAELHQRLVWWVAAAAREQSPGPAGMADRDRALTEAAWRSLSAHDEGDRPEAAAERLAAAIDPRPEELDGLLAEAVADRRLLLFVAIAARAAHLDAEQVRALLLEPDGDLLALLLHAIGIGRLTIARIGVALAEADGRRDLERWADAIDWALAHDRDAARAALAPLALGRDFRAAVRALARAGRT